MTEAAKPVAWMDEKGEFHRSPRHHFLGLVDEYCGSRDHIWSGTSLEKACEAWKQFVARGSKDVSLTGWGSGTIASHREMEERLGEPTPKGTFACPICGRDTPHQHTGEEIQRNRELDCWMQEQGEKRWEEIKARVARLEAQYPPRTPLYAHPPTDGVPTPQAPSLPGLPEAKVMVRDTDDEPEGGGWIVDCDCEGPLSYSLEAGEALYTADQMREYGESCRTAGVPGTSNDQGEKG